MPKLAAIYTHYTNMKRKIVFITLCSMFFSFWTTSCNRQDVPNAGTDNAAYRYSAGNGECPLCCTWNGQYGSASACDGSPTNCYRCESAGSSSNVMRVKSAFEGGEEALQDFFNTEDWKNYFPGMPESTASAIQGGNFTMEIDGSHYVVWVDGTAIISITL